MMVFLLSFALFSCVYNLLRDKMSFYRVEGSGISRICEKVTHGSVM